jgi:hypothetical protein
VPWKVTLRLGSVLTSSAPGLSHSRIPFGSVGEGNPLEREIYAKLSSVRTISGVILAYQTLTTQTAVIIATLYRCTGWGD